MTTGLNAARQWTRMLMEKDGQVIQGRLGGNDWTELLTASVTKSMHGLVINGNWNWRVGVTG